MKAHSIHPLARWAVDDLPNLFSLLAFFIVTALLFRSFEFALIVTASLGFHELGHAAALAWYGLEWHISFGVVGAWTWSPLAGRKQLSHLSNSMIHLAGPVCSFLLALLALGLHAIWQPPDNHLLELASFSSQVGFLNLLPVGSLTDGGKIVQRMIFSLRRESRGLALLLPIGFSSLILILYGLVDRTVLPEKGSTFALGFLLVGLWMASSVLIESQHTARHRRLAPGWQSTAPMSTGEAYFLLMVVWDLLALGLVIASTTPFWLAPQYVLGSLRNIYSLIDLVVLVVL
jgi:hypothetical protein